MRMYSTKGALTKLVFALICVAHLLPVSIQQTATFSGNDIEGMQSLWAAWNSNTPNIGTNLAGWHNRTGMNDDYPCYNQKANWRGVTCLRYVTNATIGDTTTWVIGLTLSDASIGGTLPSGINQFFYMATLTLTGNPNLTGPLPKELGGLPLNVLDLHGNSFNGQVPAELSSLTNLLQLDFSGNQLTGPFPSQFNNTHTLQEYSIARNHFSGEIPPHTFETLTQLITLDLSSNAFTGALPNISTLQKLSTLNLSGSGLTNMEIPNIFNGTTLPSSIRVVDLSNLTNTSSNPQLDWSILAQKTQIEQLYLDYDSLRGTLDINNISNFNSIAQKSKAGNSSASGLQVLSLKNNSITNVVTSSSLITSVTTIIYLQGNPYCNYNSKLEDDAQRCYCKQVCMIIPVSSTSKNTTKVIIIAASVSGSIVILLAIIFVFLLHRSRKHLHDVIKRFNEADVNPKRFDYQKLRTATKNFSKDRKLGAGAYGAVYKGILSDNNVVAVKQLFLKDQKACDEFINEVILIINLQHRNLVNLKGYCLNGKEMLLIYEYVDNQDLDKILLGAHGKGMIMSWKTRYNICLGVAHGLFYLHSSTKPKIIHRDIKASNILLDKDLNPKIADFGLARPILDEKSAIMTQQLAGTKGYVAPEYSLWGQLSEKADVFSFGVLLLEIVSGRRNIDPSLPEDEVYLPNYALKLYKENSNDLMRVVDPRLHVHPDDVMEVRRVLETALLCVQTMPEKRPTMLTVVSMLVGDADIKLTVEDNTYQETWADYKARLNDLDTDFSKEPLYGGGQSSSSAGASITRALLPNKRSTSASIELSNSDLLASGRS